jgi:hypothetical protein
VRLGYHGLWVARTHSRPEAHSASPFRGGPPSVRPGEPGPYASASTTARGGGSLARSSRVTAGAATTVPRLA